MAQFWWKVFIDGVEQEKKVRANDEEAAKVRAVKVFRIKAEKTPFSVMQVGGQKNRTDTPTIPHPARPNQRRLRRVRRTVARAGLDSLTKALAEVPVATLSLVVEIPGDVREALEFVRELVDKAREQGTVKDARVSLPSQEFDAS